MRLGTLTYLQYKTGLVRDGTPTHADGSYQHGGGCPICYGNRTHKNKRRLQIIDEE